MDEGHARKLLAAAVPSNVRDVCATLTSAGHQAVTVGGAVRDALIGRMPGDWDVATSAHPEHVQQLFRHTIPTGLQHGTITVVTGKGVATHVEVTTYRGEGAYTDARRPDHVVFGVPLVEDLARRDFVINAIAYDPANDEIIDPFGGIADLERNVLRAVGDPIARFTEDGLRVMRAVRFVAVLEVALDAATEAGIAPALPSLAKVSRERVSDELRKLLAARRPSLGLAIALRTGILTTILPADVVPRLAIDRVDAAAPELRLAALMMPLRDRERVAELLRGLKFSNAEIDLSAACAGALPGIEAARTPFELRKVLSRIGRDHARAVMALVPVTTVPASDPLVLKELNITGGEVIKALAMTPGPQVGRILEGLLEYVLEDPARNTRDELLRRAQQLELELGH
jgi:tRNA nucleotidyltransferase (CCA-adding enzyme)